MVPCPWFPDFARYYKDHPHLDVGIHITLTAEWDYYKWGEMIEKMIPGLNQLIVHVAYDNAEMQALAINHPAFGATWRQQDLDLLVSQEFGDLLRKHNIHLVSWKEISEVL